MVELKKVDLEELKNLSYEEREKLLESLEYYTDGVASHDEECPISDYVEEVQWTLYNEEDEEIDVISYSCFYNKNPKDPEGLSDFIVKEEWSRVE